MARAALNRLLAVALLLALAPSLVADVRGEEQARHLARADNAIWQLLFGRRVVQEAEKQLGKPYLWGAKDGAQGFDCSGLSAYVYSSLGVAMAPNAMGQFGQGIGIERGGLLPGDLVFFMGRGSPFHVGIYAGDGRFIHAPGTGKVIQYAALNDAYFRDRYLGARRLTPDLKAARAQRGPKPDLSPTKSTPLYKEKAP